MNIKCPWCGVPIQYHKPPLPDGFECPGCGKEFSETTIEDKELGRIQKLKDSLYQLYESGIRSRSSLFAWILLDAITNLRGNAANDWELSECPTKLKGLSEHLELQDYDPEHVAVFTSTKKYTKIASARLLRIILKTIQEKLDIEIESRLVFLQEEIIDLILTTLAKEKDIGIVEILCDALDGYTKNRIFQERGMKTIQKILDNHGRRLIESYAIDPALRLMTKLDADLANEFKSAILEHFGREWSQEEIDLLRQKIQKKGSSQK